MVPLRGGLVPAFTVAFGNGRLRLVKYLDLMISSGLKFESHVGSVTKSSLDLFSRL